MAAIWRHRNMAHFPYRLSMPNFRLLLLELHVEVVYLILQRTYFALQRNHFMSHKRALRLLLTFPLFTLKFLLLLLKFPLFTLKFLLLLLKFPIKAIHPAIQPRHLLFRTRSLRLRRQQCHGKPRQDGNCLNHVHFWSPLTSVILAQRTLLCGL